MLRLATVLTTAVASISLGFVAAFPAYASPTPTPTPPTSETPAVTQKSNSDNIYVDVKINAGQADFVRTASKLLKKGRDGVHLDWRKAKSYWGKHTKTRDSFASGWLVAGGKLDHASASTIKRLKGLKNTNRIMANPDASAKKPTCKGENKVTHPNSQTEDHYYDSCRTADMIDLFDTCARWSGTVALLTKNWKPAAAVGVLLIASCNQGSGTIKSVRDRSDLDAFIWRTTTYKGYNGGYETVAELLPQ